MSPKPNPWDRFTKSGSQADVPADPVVPTHPMEPPHSEVVPTPPTAPQVDETSPRPLVTMSELDAYIHERMKDQPSDLVQAEAMLESREATGLHRLSLPDELERLSYDCTRGDACQIHQRNETGIVLNPGKYVFRWIMKHKQALDYALNVKDWLLVNRVYFQDLPKHLFGINGGVEVGDAILAFMPVKAALAIREAPGRKSKEMLRSQMTSIDATRVLMTGNPKQEHVYEPDWGAAEREPATAETAPAAP